MIFVALGIIILVVSFMVALVSLLKEQRQQQASRPSAESSHQGRQLPESNKVATSKRQTSPKLSDVKQVKPQFPWEEDLGPGLESKVLVGELKQDQKLSGQISIGDLAKRAS